MLVAAFMVVLDFSIVIVALSSIQRELGVSAATVQWVVTGYAIAFGGLLILGGRAGDLYGRRRLFLAGIAVFTAASLAGGLARDPVLLIASRVVQGSGPRWSRPPHCHSSPRASPSMCRCSRSRSWNPGARRPRHRPLPNSPPTAARLTARWSRRRSATAPVSDTPSPPHPHTRSPQGAWPLCRDGTTAVSVRSEYGVLLGQPPASAGSGPEHCEYEDFAIARASHEPLPTCTKSPLPVSTADR